MDDNKRSIEYVKRILLLRRKKSKKKTIPVNKVNRTLEKSYRNILLSLITQLEKVIKAELTDSFSLINSDVSLSPADVITDAFDTINLRAAVMVVSALNHAETVINKMDNDNKAKFFKSMKEIVGIELSPVIKSENVQQQLQILTEANFNLIKSIPEKELTELKTIVLSNLSQGKFEQSELTEILQKQFGITKKRAFFIAKDQSHKISASLSKIRNQSVGITEYKWRNSNDIRVRGNPVGLYPKSEYNHWTREGKIYSYDDTTNPPDGQPGMPIRCRCYAEAVIPEMYE